MGQRYILALVLMVIVMFAWSLLFGNRMSKQRSEEKERQLTEQSRETQSSHGGEDFTDANEQQSTDESGRYTQIEQSTEAHVWTERYEITFAVEPAIAKKWILKTYQNRSETGEFLNLIPSTSLNWLAVQFSHAQLQLDAMRATWTANKSEVNLTGDSPEMEDSITFTTQIGDDIKVSKEFTFYRDSYYVDLKLRFQNLSDSSLSTLQVTNENQENGYKLRCGPGIDADLLLHEQKHGGKGRWGKSAGAKAYTGVGKAEKELNDSQLREPLLWAGLNNNYFAALMIPQDGLNAQYLMEDLKDNGTPPALNVAAPIETASLIIPGFPLEANARKTHTFRIYVGPKDTAILKQVQSPVSPETPLRLSKIIDLGFFWPVAWALLWLLNGLHGIFRNYGVAIILLTALVKVVSFPLTHKGHKSMKEMQKLQPLITELREKYRDDPQKLNKATMRLYKEHGVNPLGGCIPYLPQIPIFIALFSLLGSAVELRGAPFLLWIDDLSAPDAIAALPFTIPLVNIDTIRLLPLLNGLTTWLQQKVMGNMTPVTDNFQAKLMQFMPLIFVFLFYNWASGFVLYWLCNNVFTIAQQYLQSRGSNGADETIAKPLASTKSLDASKKPSPSPKQKRKK
ncbi:MAG: membrane protein insertase YidC [Candidatus Poribacteria bacterium]|nr:membrane protein insertase YidC [Candidatus Poribacteria bacterium]MDE0505541.1 membrane protein insertase YidC [Candidatus Poribacteria bacterium]